MPADKARADKLLFESGLAASEHEANARIMTGKVMATDGRGRERKVEKAGQQLDRASTFRFAGQRHPFVSRGGLKLAGALDRFGIDPDAMTCADIGVSTGGFTDCLLQRGARRVFGVDVGYGQVAWRIRTNERVTLFARTNIKDLAQDAFGPVDLLVADLSFIRLAPLVAHLGGFVASGGALVVLVKPQFELPSSEVPSGGVVRDPATREAARQSVLDAAQRAGLSHRGEIESPIRGADGNVEYLLWLSR